MFKIIMLLILISVSCGPTPSSNKENKQETKIGCVSWGKITTTNPIGISEYDKNGKEIFQEYLIKESGPSLYIGSYTEECLITIDGHIAAIDEIKTGMIVKAKYSDGTEKEITGYSYSPTSALTTNNNTIIRKRISIRRWQFT